MKNYFPLCLPLILLFVGVPLVCSSQNSMSSYELLNWNTDNDGFQETYQDSLIQWRERVVLHIASENVDNGKMVFFKAYLLTGVPQSRFSISNVLNVELLDLHGTLLKRQFHKVSEGMTEGNLELPKNTKPGTYYIRAYTRWMQNYGVDHYAQKRINIGESLGKTKEKPNNSDFTIIPEGGTLLNGHENRLIIKIPQSPTMKTGIIGKILDSNNKEVAIIKMYYANTASTIFKPIPGIDYRVTLNSGYTYPIPKVLDHGYLLQVNNLDDINAKVRITASSEFVGKAVKLVGISDGINYFEKQISFKDTNIVNIEFSKKGIPSGTLFLKLIDDVGIEYASRPIRVDAERLLIDISPMAINGGEAVYKVKVFDATNLPVKTQITVSAKKSESEYNTDLKDNIFGYADMVTFPEMTIGNYSLTDRNHRYLMDLNVLLSETKLNNNLKTDGTTYPFQKGLELIGYAYDLDNRLLRNTKIQIIAQNDDGWSFNETETGSNGILKLDKMQINGNTTLVFRTKGKNTKSRLVKVKLSKEMRRVKGNLIAMNTKSKEQIVKVETSPQQLTDTLGLIKLEEVEVTDNNIDKKKSSPSVYGINIPKNKIKYQNPKKPKDIAQMISEIPGVVVRGIGGLTPSVVIYKATGAGPILWVIDGFPIQEGNHGLGLGSSVQSSLNDIMNMISAEDVDRIELLIGADAAMYGTRGAGGVIAIYTRSGKESKYTSRKDGQLKYQGYEPLLEFTSYQQELSNKTRKKSDLLYWNPKLETDENGEAIFRIPISSAGTAVRIEASAITTDGKIGSTAVDF